MSKLKPVTPGELLLKEHLKSMGMSQYRLAREIGVPTKRIGEIVAGKRSITTDTNLRLCNFSAYSNRYWLCAQTAHDTEVAEQKMGSEKNQALDHCCGSKMTLQPTAVLTTTELDVGIKQFN